MAKFKVIYIYKTEADTSYQARVKVEKLVEAGEIEPDSLFATEDRPKGWWKTITSQMGGK